MTDEEREQLEMIRDCLEPGSLARAAQDYAITLADEEGQP